ncbi:MAG TPA: protein kinase [Polyangiaceae bacterium]|nr:protein kinase [Polyangiaceae bacterium]
MLEAPIPADEERRLALLRACNILYTPAEQAFDDVAQLAADLCGAEIALITLVDADYQWFKARVGVEQTGVSRDMSFCGHCIAAGEALIVPDTHLDPRFADNPLVTGNPGIRFYTGVPLEVEAGSAIGALSVADRRPRTISPRQLESLRRLAEQIARELRLRRDLERVISTLPPSELLVGPGAVVAGRWHIGRELGRGGVGAVFEAHDANGERAAIKVLLPEWRAHEEVLERFAREARVLMRLTTPYVGKLLDVGNLEAAQGGLPYLVLEYLEGTDLGRLIETQGKVPFRQAFAWCADACEGVAEAHELGVVHRDLKPSNVFLARTLQSPAMVKVLDFGIAAGEPAAGNPVKLTGMRAVVGSPAYMSPEQMIAASEVDPQSDIWSMGVTLYELITGKIPFPGATALEIFAAVMTHAPTPPREHLNQNLPGAVEAILLKCLQKERTDRFPSMVALARTLRAAAT